MTHFYIKPHFSGWQKVGKEHFDAFVKNFMHHASGMSEVAKKEYIKTITRIEEDAK